MEVLLIICFIFLAVYLFWPYLLGIIGIVAVVVIITLVIQHSESKHTEEIEISMEDVDGLDGHKFEYFVASVLSKNGFSNVQVTKASGDYGVDITATKDRVRWAFQCKCYQSTLGLKPIQEVYAGAKKYNASRAAVVTNSHFSKNAKILAQELGVELWDRRILGEMVLKDKKIVEQPKIEPAKICSSVTQNQKEEPAKVEIKTKIEEKVKDFDMATIIGAGKYVFGEDVPVGKFDLKVVSGSGMLMIQTSEADGEDEVEEKWQNMGIGKKGFAETYRGLSLPAGWYFAIDGDLKVEISKTKMLEIE